MQALVSLNGRFTLIDASPPSIDAPDSVRVRVEMISLNRGETTVLWGEGGSIGWDAYGIVAETSEDGLGPAVGSRVTTWASSGAWAQERVVSRRNLAVIPDGVDSCTAAALPVAGLTALHAVRGADIRPGQRVAVTGAFGGVGHLTIQLAADAGAQVVALTREPDRAAALSSVIRHGDITVSDMGGIADDDEFDVVIDTVGGHVLSRLVLHLARQARVIMVGSATGESAQIDTGLLTSKRIDILSVAIPTPVGGDLERLLTLAAEDRLRVVTSDLGEWTRLTDDSVGEALGKGKSVFHVPADRG